MIDIYKAIMRVHLYAYINSGVKYLNAFICPMCKMNKKDMP